MKFEQEWEALQKRQEFLKLMAEHYVAVTVEFINLPAALRRRAAPERARESMRRLVKIQDELQQIKDELEFIGYQNCSE